MASLGVIRRSGLLFLTIVDKFGTFSTIWTPLRKLTLFFPTSQECVNLSANVDELSPWTEPGPPFDIGRK